MKVVWTELAKQQLQGIYDYIEPQSEFYARRMVDKLVLRADGLGDFPEMGSKVPEYEDPNIRQLIVSPYRVIYVVQRNRIDIIGVIHTSRNRI
jgi:toxin ParE1/3/4